MSPVHSYGAFSLFVAVAPSDSAGSTPLVDFVDAAHTLVRTSLADMFTGTAVYSGAEVVRYEQPLTQDATSPRNIVCVYPSGLIELQYVLALPPETNLPLEQITGVIARLHQLVAGDTYPAIYQRRRFEKWRRVDWRIGVNGSALPANGSGSLTWTNLVTPATLPTVRIADPRPACPRDGYAAGQITSARRSGLLVSLLVPVIEELLLSAGYTSKAEIQRCASAVAGLPGRDGRAATC